MPSSTFTLAGYPARLRELAAKHRVAARRAMYAAAQLLKREAVREIDGAEPRPAVDTGEMRRSYVVARLPDGASLENTAKHAPIMEYGTKPFTPPMKPLIAWAERKTRGRGPVRPRRTVKKKTVERQSAAKQVTVGGKRVSRRRQRQIEQLARAAWLGIRKRGIEPRGYHAKAMKKAPQLLRKALIYELAKVGR